MAVGGRWQAPVVADAPLARFVGRWAVTDGVVLAAVAVLTTPA